MSEKSSTSKSLTPGTVLEWRGGDPSEPRPLVTLKERKADDTGWWLVEQGGLADSVMDSDTSMYRVVGDYTQRRVLALLAEADELACREATEPADNPEAVSIQWSLAHGKIAAAHDMVSAIPQDHPE